MKKNLFFVITFLSSALIFAQAPSNYYVTATGSGYVLKSQLKTIISANHTDLSYGGLWNLYSSNNNNNGFRDKYFENDNTILDIYSEKPISVDSYNFTVITDQCGSNGYKKEGDCYNREHLIPQSYFDENTPMKTDAFHVWPSDGKVNGERGNLPFGTVSTANYTSQNGTKRGSSAVPNYSGTVFEPIDEFKGDIARAFFYFATRYEDYMDDFYTNTNQAQTQVKAMFDGSTDKVFNTDFLNILYQWHLSDPVSQREIDLNNYIYAEQGNRNPFIDQPNYVYDIWYQSLNNSEFNFDNSLVIYPNPSNQNHINISSSEIINELKVFTIDGKLIHHQTKPSNNNGVYQINLLPSGTFILHSTSNNRTTTKTFVIN